MPVISASCLLGRPYTIFSPGMNKGIPDIFSRHGIKTFFQDMLPDEGDDGETDDVRASWTPSTGSTRQRSWRRRRRLPRTDGVYPVFVTSFKCTPDSYVMEYFKKILDNAGKPYLILQLDEHDSSVGYETRIEAGIRSFRNHRPVFRKRGRSAPHHRRRGPFEGEGDFRRQNASPAQLGQDIVPLYRGRAPE